MKRVLLGLLFGSMLINTQAAAPTDQSIEEMMKAVQLELLIGQTVAQMDGALKAGVAEGFKQSTNGKEPTSAQRAAVEKCQQKLSSTMKTELSIEKIKGLYVQAYRETFTQEEVDGVIAFYASPAGHALTEKLPTAMQAAGGQMQTIIAPLMKKLETMRVDCMKEVTNAK